MSIRKFFKLTRVGTKAALVGGTVYIYYDAGLWRSSDETIENYAKVKTSVRGLYESTPKEVQKWAEYATSTAASNVEPYTKAVGDFRKEWLNFDMTFITEKGDGVVKPTWNRGVAWTFETLKDSPDTIQRWGNTGWQKMTELVNDTSSPASGSSDTQQNQHYTTTTLFVAAVSTLKLHKLCIDMLVRQVVKSPR